jgi:hypothetical protein
VEANPHHAAGSDLDEFHVAPIGVQGRANDAEHAFNAFGKAGDVGMAGGHW